MVYLNFIFSVCSLESEPSKGEDAASERPDIHNKVCEVPVG